MKYSFAVGLFNISVEEAPKGYDCYLTFGSKTLMSTDVYRSKYEAYVAMLEKFIRMSQNNIIEAEKLIQNIKQQYSDEMNGK